VATRTAQYRECHQAHRHKSAAVRARNHSRIGIRAELKCRSGGPESDCPRRGTGIAPRTNWLGGDQKRLSLAELRRCPGARDSRGDSRSRKDGHPDQAFVRSVELGTIPHSTPQRNQPQVVLSRFEIYDVLVRLLHENRLGEEHLRGLRENKLAANSLFRQILDAGRGLTCVLRDWPVRNIKENAAFETYFDIPCFTPFTLLLHMAAV